MSSKTNTNNISVNLCTFILFLGLFSSSLGLSTKTNSLDRLKFDLDTKINNYPYLKTGSGLDPDSMQGILSKMIQLSQQPESEEQTKTFSMMIEKSRKLVDEMLKEQKDSDVIFKKNSAMLFKYFIRSRNNNAILQDKYNLNKKLVKLLNNLKSTNGSLDVKVQFDEIIESFKDLNDYLHDLKHIGKKFDKISTEYFDEVQKQIADVSLIISKNITNPWENNLIKLKDQIEKLPWVKAMAIKNSFMMDIDTYNEILLLSRYKSIFSKQKNTSSGTIKKEIFESIDTRIKNAENYSNQLNVKIKNEMDVENSSKNSLSSIFNEYIQNTEKRTEIISTILKILDFMNIRIKKVSVKFMVYLESVKDGFKEYVNSYEFTKIKKYIFKNILFNEEGIRLTDDFQKNRKKC